MNVLYLGIDNPVSFTVENIKCNELELVVDNGTAKRTGDCDYDVVVTKSGPTFISLIKGTDTIYKTKYRAKAIPDISTGVRSDKPHWVPLDTLRLDSLRALKGIDIVRNTLEIDMAYPIVSFDITVIRIKQWAKEGKTFCDKCFQQIEKEHYDTIFSGTNMGQEFNAPLKDIIQNKLAPGDRVFIENIKTLAPDNRIRKLNSIIFRVQ